MVPDMNFSTLTFINIFWKQMYSYVKFPTDSKYVKIISGVIDSFVKPLFSHSFYCFFSCYTLMITALSSCNSSNIPIYVIFTHNYI